MTTDAKTVMITGADSLVGRALIDAIAATGARLALVVRSLSRTETLQRELTGRGIDAFVWACDLRREEDVIRLVHRVMQRYTHIDAVVHAAVAPGPIEKLTESPADAWLKAMDTNINSTFLLCREVIPWMLQNRSGTIILVTGRPAGRAVASKLSAMQASACAVESLSASLNDDLKTTGIRVTPVELIFSGQSPDPVSIDGFVRGCVSLVKPGTIASTVNPPMIYTRRGARPPGA